MITLIAFGYLQREYLMAAVEGLLTSSKDWYSWGFLLEHLTVLHSVVGCGWILWVFIMCHSILWIIGFIKLEPR